jgi:hypothetical protein
MTSRTTLPLYPVAVIVADQVRLRIYEGQRLVLDLPLSRRRALLLGSDLICRGLLPEYLSASNDADVPDRSAR